MNDAATLVISVDNAKISHSPAKWRLGQLLFLSFVLGILLMGISFSVYFVAKLVFKVTPAQLQTIMYLQISSCPHFVIFSTRLETWFWKSFPSLVFISSILGTQIFAMFMSIYGVDFFQAVPIGWGWGLSIIGISLLCFMLLDVVKVLIIRYWSFELTAYFWPVPSRRKELKRRKKEKLLQTKIQGNIAKVRKVVNAVWFIKYLRKNVKK